MPSCKAEYLPPAEIRQALVAVVRVHLGVSPDEAIVQTARLFGFKSTGAQVRDALQDELGCLMQNATFEQRNGRLYINSQARATGPLAG